MRRFAVVLLAGLVLAGCETWLGESAKPPLPGTRIAVLVKNRDIKPDAPPGARVQLASAVANTEWPQVGGLPHHAVRHVAFGAAPRRLWQADAGDGASDRARVLTPPVVAAGRLYAIDAAAVVTAFDAGDGRRLWSVAAAPKDESDGNLGGGLAYDGGRLFVATGFGQVVALKAEDGQELWRSEVSGPVRGAPTVRAGRVFVISIDNQTHALSAEDGRPLWKHGGIGEMANLLGATSPAVEGGAVVVPYSSGELFALRADNGTPLWGDALAAVRRTDAIATLTDIRGLPVIDGGRVYAIGNSDLMIAVDLRSGRRLWDREIGGTQTPWVAGDYLFVVTNRADLVAMDARTGQVVWVKALPPLKEKPAVWAGPVLAGDRLVLVNQAGAVLWISPYTGDVVAEDKLPGGATLPPVAAGGTLYFITADAEVVAYR